MGFLDAFLLPLLIGIPVVGAVFVALMPSSDRIALRHVGMGAMIANAVVAARALTVVLSDVDALARGADALTIAGLSLDLNLDGVNAFAVFGCALVMPMALRAGAPQVHKETKGYVAALLVSEALALAAMCAANPLNAFVFASALTYPLMLVLGMHGGATKGSTALRMGTLWAVVDAFALAALVYLDVKARRQGLSIATPELWTAIEDLSLVQQSVLAAPLLLAGTTRLACLPLTSWVDPFFDDAPVSVASLLCVVVLPLGAVLTFRFGLAWMPRGSLFLLPTLAVLSGLTALLGGIRGWVERDLRKHVAGVVEVIGAITLAGLCTLDDVGSTVALYFVTAAGMGAATYLFVIDGIERRYVTRDTGELIGLSDQLPRLWRVFLLASFALVGVPLLAGGTAMWMILVILARSDTFEVAGAPPILTLWVAIFCGGAAALCAVGTAGHLRRTSAPPVKSTIAVPSPFTAGQASRMWIPVLFVIALGLSTSGAWPRLVPAVRKTIIGAARTLDVGNEPRKFERFRTSDRDVAASPRAHVRPAPTAGTRREVAPDAAPVTKPVVEPAVAPDVEPIVAPDVESIEVTSSEETAAPAPVDAGVTSGAQP